MIRILYFAWLRERVGTGEQTLALPPHIGTVAGLISFLCGQGEGYRAAFSNPGLVRAAVNQVFAQPATALRAGDEVAFFPPVTGG